MDSFTEWLRTEPSWEDVSYFDQIPESKPELIEFIKKQDHTLRDHYLYYAHRFLKVSLVELQEEFHPPEDLSFLVEDFDRNQQKPHIQKYLFVPEKKGLSLSMKVFIFFFFFALLGYGLHRGKRLYEKYLEKKLSVEYPELQWKGPPAAFDQYSVEAEEHDLQNFKELKELEDNTPNEESESSGGESDLLIASLDQVPQSLSYASGEKSDYEELTKGGLRGLGTGSFRVMMNSHDIDRIHQSMDVLIEDFSAKPASQVEPGKRIPGGRYYHLFVKESLASRFLNQVVKLDDTKIYRGRNTQKIPKGYIRVFIWVKSI